MRFLDVEIQNFLSFGPSQTVPLERRGMVAVFGENRDSSGADSNGAGKSTVLEAVVWALYGETMRGYTGDEVVNRNVGKDCVVRLRIEDSGKEYVVERLRKYSGRKKPNDLVLKLITHNGGADVSGGTTADTQDMILTLVGMDSTTFCQAVMLYHGARPFSKMTDKEAKQVLEDIMRTDTVTRAQTATKGRVVEAQSQMGEVRLKLSNLVQAIRDLEVQVSKLTTQRDQHATLMEDRRRELVLKRVHLEMRLEDTYQRTGLDALIALRDHQTDELSHVELQLSEIRTNELGVTQDYGGKLTTLARDEGMVIGRLKQIGADLQRFNQLVGNPCPTCKQVLTPDAADACLQDWTNEKTALEGKLKEFTKKKQKIDRDQKKATDKVTGSKAEVEAKVSEIRALLQGTASDIQKRSSDLQTICDLEQQIYAYDEEISSLEESQNPYQGLIDQATRDLEAKRTEQRNLQAREHVLDVQLRHLNFLVNAFGNAGLKSYVLDTVVPQLTERAQHYADILSGGDITITFDTQTKLKTGGVAERFQVQAVNRFGADVYQGNSDGEKRRVDLAVGWALGDLAATRASKQIRFKGLDEPFANVDETGEDAVIRLLHSVVKDYETILVITHSTHLQSQFQNQLTVIKQNGVSQIA